MIFIPIFWRQYTATVHGRGLKVVTCENCSSDYVYIIQREGLGSGTSLYLLNNEGAANDAKSAAEDTLKCVLENDFDPVPCPACGHYQRYMFPKLLETKGSWIQIAMLAVLAIVCLAAVMALYCSFTYLQYPNDLGFGTMVETWSVLLLLCLCGLGLSILNKRNVSRFDPNREDQQARIAIGRTRAVTRAEFDKGQRGSDGPEAVK